MLIETNWQFRCKSKIKLPIKINTDVSHTYIYMCASKVHENKFITNTNSIANNSIKIYIGSKDIKKQGKIEIMSTN